MSGSTRRIWLVTRREWNQRARTRAFQISTLVSVAIVVALIMVPEIYGGGDTPTRTVGWLAATPRSSHRCFVPPEAGSI